MATTYTERTEVYKKLIHAIIIQAVDDYKYLKRNNLEHYRDRGSRDTYSVKELERFFKGKWGNALIDSTNINLTGNEVLSKISQEGYHDLS